MGRLFAICVGLVWAATAQGQGARPYQLAPDDQAVIERFVAEETLTPERTRVTGIIATPSRSGLIYACGYVSWINSSGLFGPYRPFAGYLGTNESGEAMFSVSEIAHDDRAEERISGNCARKSIALGDVVPAVMLTAPDAAATLIERFEDLNGQCIEGGGYDTGSQICTDGIEAAKAVREAGWCEIMPDLESEQFLWKPCN